MQNIFNPLSTSVRPFIDSLPEERYHALLSRIVSTAYYDEMESIELQEMLEAANKLRCEPPVSVSEASQRMNAAPRLGADFALASPEEKATYFIGAASPVALSGMWELARHIQRGTVRALEEDGRIKIRDTRRDQGEQNRYFQFAEKTAPGLMQDRDPPCVFSVR